MLADATLFIGRSQGLPQPMGIIPDRICHGQPLEAKSIKESFSGALRLDQQAIEAAFSRGPLRCSEQLCPNSAPVQVRVDIDAVKEQRLQTRRRIHHIGLLPSRRADDSTASDGRNK